MSADLTYFRYIVAQYAHSRREERLNVGVIVHDPQKATVRSHFDTRTATRRIKSAFPDVDARGLTSFLREMGEAVLVDPALNAMLDKPEALTAFAGGWRNAIQFTSVRSVPAKTITDALAQLAKLYVDEIPAALHQVPTAKGIPFAISRTRQALRDVLQLEQGFGYDEFREDSIIHGHRGKELRYPVIFPFYVYSRFLIDTLSFRGDSYPAKFDVAGGFIQKVELLRKIDGADALVPCISYVADDDRPEQTETLIAQIQEKLDLPDERIVNAAEADKLARYIGENRGVAA